MSLSDTVLRDKYLSVNQTAALFGVRYDSMIRAIGRGAVPSITINGRRYVPKQAVAERYGAHLANPTPERRRSSG